MLALAVQAARWDDDNEDLATTVRGPLPVVGQQGRARCNPVVVVPPRHGGQPTGVDVHRPSFDERKIAQGLTPPVCHQGLKGLLEVENLAVGEAASGGRRGADRSGTGRS